MDVCHYSFLQTPRVGDTKTEPVYYGLREVATGAMRFASCNKAQPWWGMWIIRAVMYAQAQEQILDEKLLALQLNLVMSLKLLKIKFIRKNQFSSQLLPTSSQHAGINHSGFMPHRVTAIPYCPLPTWHRP